VTRGELRDGDVIPKATLPRDVKPTAGPILRIAISGATWLFPTDQAEQAERFLNRRIAAARTTYHLPPLNPE
jgi:hypothetical protein